MAGVLASSSGVANDHKVHPEDGSRPDSPTDSSKPKKPDTLRNKVYQTCDDPSYSKLAKVISAIMMMVILISTMSFVLEAEVQIGGSLYEVRDDAKPVFQWIENVCVVLFTIDYLVRLLSCPKLLPFVLNVMNLIDLAAVAPFWVFLIVNAINGGQTSENFGFIRVIRLIRVFRVFKFGRYSVGLQMFAGALKGSVQPLGILVFVMSINMIILSSIVHIFEVVVEDPVTGDADHKRCFGTISRTFWWAMVTMTTVGYGDCYPLSGVGKVFAVVAMLSGVLILALPITVIGSNFAKMVEMFEDDAAVYQMTDVDGDGLVDEMELREFLTRKRKEGVLRKDVDTRVSTLLEKYDPQGNGTLSMQEFLQLQRDIVDTSTLDPAVEIHDMHSKITQHERQVNQLSHVIERRIVAIERFLDAMGDHVGAPVRNARPPPPAAGTGSSLAVGFAHVAATGAAAAERAAAAEAGSTPPPALSQHLPDVATASLAGQLAPLESAPLPPDAAPPPPAPGGS